METKQRLNNQINVRQYRHGDCHIVEMDSTSPSQNITFKYQNNHAQVTKNGQIIYDGNDFQEAQRKFQEQLYGSNYSMNLVSGVDLAIDKLDHTLDIFDDKLDLSLEQLDQSLDILDYQLDSLEYLFEQPTYVSPQRNTTHHSQHTSNRANSSSHRTNRNRHNNTTTYYSSTQKKHSSGCLGCLIWTIIIIGIISIILYGLGVLGGTIIGWIVELFKLIF